MQSNPFFLITHILQKRMIHPIRLLCFTSLYIKLSENFFDFPYLLPDDNIPYLKHQKDI